MSKLPSHEDIQTEMEKYPTNLSEPPSSSQKRPCGTFSDLDLSPHDVLDRCTRTKCTATCGKKRRYYCSECVVPLLTPPDSFPQVKLPLYVEILQSGAEVPQRSTAQHVALLAKGFARVWRPFPECVDEFRKNVLEGVEEGSVAVLYVFSVQRAL